MEKFAGKVIPLGPSAGPRSSHVEPQGCGERCQPSPGTLHGLIAGCVGEIDVQERLAEPVGHLTSMKTSSREWTPGDDQSAIGITDVPRGSNGVVRRAGLPKSIVLRRDHSILGKPPCRDPSTVDNAEFESDIECGPIDSCLTSRPDLCYWYPCPTVHESLATPNTRAGSVGGMREGGGWHRPAKIEPARGRGEASGPQMTAAPFSGRIPGTDVSYLGSLCKHGFRCSVARARAFGRRLRMTADSRALVWRSSGNSRLVGARGG